MKLDAKNQKNKHTMFVLSSYFWKYLCLIMFLLLSPATPSPTAIQQLLANQRYNCNALIDQSLTSIPVEIYKTFYTKHLFPEWSVIFHSSSGQGVQSICAYHPPLSPPPLAHRSPIFSALFLLLSPWNPCSFLLSNDVCQNCPSLLEVALLAIWRTHVLPNLINFREEKNSTWPMT